MAFQSIRNQNGDAKPAGTVGTSLRLTLHHKTPQDQPLTRVLTLMSEPQWRQNLGSQTRAQLRSNTKFLPGPERQTPTANIVQFDNSLGVPSHTTGGTDRSELT
jgi:hypothetical protein